MKAQKSVVVAFLLALFVISGFGAYLLHRRNAESARKATVSESNSGVTVLGTTVSKTVPTLSVIDSSRTVSNLNLTLKIVNDSTEEIEFIAGIELFLRDSNKKIHPCAENGVISESPKIASKASKIITVSCSINDGESLEGLYYQPNSSDETIKISSAL